MNHFAWLLLTIAVIIIFGLLRRIKNMRSRNAKLNSELRTQIDESNRQRERAKTSERYKEFFLANMSHEIRTPMHAISGMTNILRRNAHPAEQDKYLDAIHQSAENLLVILNDILDSSKLEAGKLKIDSIPMQPNQVITDVVEILKYKAEDNGLFLTSKIDATIPDFVYGDPIRLNQILTNLASNAIKFTERGGVNIQLNRIEKNGQALMDFSVTDTGIGIPDDKMKTIFEVFEQVDGTLSKKFGGTGLGLSICKQLVEMQGGEIRAESQLGKGSTFGFYLPLKEADGNQESQTIISEDEAKRQGRLMQGLNVLLVEDNDFNVMLATDDLTYYIPEIKITNAENGLVAIEKYKSNSYDLIIMDMQMPEMNGYDATIEIRRMEAENQITQPIPIIAMTASLLKQEIMRCYEVGINNYIPKPYQIDQLIGTIYDEFKKVQKKAASG